MTVPGNLDYLQLDDDLSEQEKLVRSAARQFVQGQAVPLIRLCYAEGRFPAELIPGLAEMGFFGANLEGYGCAAMSSVEYGLLMQEVERCDSGLRSFLSVQGALVMFPILKYGSEEQKNRWLPRMQSGKAVGCFGLTEPDFGSNPGGMRTSAHRDGAQWVLNGEKTWITNGSIADVALIWAQTGEGVRGFLVEQGTPGLLNIGPPRQDVHARLCNFQPFIN